jgi:hypothetical protein
MSTDTKKPSANVRSEPQDLDQQIRLRAYQLYEARGSGRWSRARRLAPCRRGIYVEEGPHHCRLISTHFPQIRSHARHSVVSGFCCRSA